MKFRSFLVLFSLCLLLSLPVLAQDERELSQNPPVAIVALAQGSAQIQHPGQGWRPAHWLTLVRPEDRLQTGTDGKIVVTYFHDYHREVIDPETAVKAGFRSLSMTSADGNIRIDQPKGRNVAEIPIPYLLTRQLARKEFDGADQPGELDRENTFLSSHVKAEAFPPVFNWSDTGAQRYKIQLFNEWDEFLYEAETTENHFKYPYRANFQLAKNSLYKWQVLDQDDRIVVRKYSFILLTSLHSREVANAERNYERLEASGNATNADLTDLFLLYVKRKMIDKYLHALQKMESIDPHNPVIHRGLTRAYLSKGAPAHAWESLQKEYSYGGEDPLRD